MSTVPFKAVKKRIMSLELHSMANLSLNNCVSEKKMQKKKRESSLLGNSELWIRQ